MKRNTVQIGDTVYVTTRFLSHYIIVEAQVVRKATTPTFDPIHWSNSEFTEMATSKEWFHTYVEAAEQCLNLIAIRRKALIKNLQRLDEVQKHYERYVAESFD